MEIIHQVFFFLVVFDPFLLPVVVSLFVTLRDRPVIRAEFIVCPLKGAAVITYSVSGITCALPHFLAGAQVNADRALGDFISKSSLLSQQAKIFSSLCDVNNTWSTRYKSSGIPVAKFPSYLSVLGILKLRSSHSQGIILCTLELTCF